MPRRYRGIVAAVVIATALFAPPAAFWISASLGHEERRQERTEAGATYARYAEQQEYCARDGVLPGPQMTTCIIERANAQTEHEQAQADLRAQQEVAVWTGGVFGLGVVGWLVSIVGIWFLYANLQLLQRQIKREQVAAIDQAVQFQKQLDKMEAANEITRRNGRAQVRAYLAISGVSLSFARDAKTTVMMPEPNAPPIAEDAVLPSIFFEVKNFGSSPAINFRWKPSVKLMAYFVKDEGVRAIERQSPRNFPLESSPNEWGESIQSTANPVHFNTKYGFALNDVENYARTLPKEKGGLNVVLVISYHATDVFGLPISDQVTFSGTLHDGRENVSFSTQFPIIIFETQEEIQRRAMTEKAGRVAMIDDVARNESNN